MIKVTLPNKAFTGNRVGLFFVNGVAECEELTPSQLAMFTKKAAQGYVVEGLEPVAASHDAPESPPKKRGRPPKATSHDAPEES